MTLTAAGVALDRNLGEAEQRLVQGRRTRTGGCDGPIVGTSHELDKVSDLTVRIASEPGPVFGRVPYGMQDRFRASHAAQGAGTAPAVTAAGRVHSMTDCRSDPKLIIGSLSNQTT